MYLTESDSTVLAARIYSYYGGKVRLTDLPRLEDTIQGICYDTTVGYRSDLADCKVAGTMHTFCTILAV